MRLPGGGAGFCATRRAPILQVEQRPMTFVDQKRTEMQTRPEITWTDDRVELLKRLWADGLSASQIAGELGGITRNAVIGKVHRLGLSGRAKAPSSPRPRRPHAPAREPIENIMPIGQRCTLLELNEEKCHWPIGDPGQPDFFFCGGKTTTGTPYCGYHGRVAYQPPAARRDRRPSR